MIKTKQSQIKMQYDNIFKTVLLAAELNKVPEPIKTQTGLGLTHKVNNKILSLKFIVYDAINLYLISLTVNCTC